MRINRALYTLSLTAIAISSESSLAQMPARQAPASPPVPEVNDVQSLPTIRGEFERFTLTGRGDIDGFILKDGTEIKTTPELSAQLVGFANPGDPIEIHGLRAAALPLVRAVSLTNRATHRMATESAVAAVGPTPPPPPGAPSIGSTTELSGRVRLSLHGAQGEVNGVLLENGTILRIPPDQAAAIAAFMQPHQIVIAQGLALTTPAGTVMDVVQIGPSNDKLVSVGPPTPPAGDRGPAGPRARARLTAPPPPPPPPSPVG